MKYSVVTCGQTGCGKQTTFVVCQWPPAFFWCRYCQSVFNFERSPHTNAAIWQLRGFPTS